MCFVCACEYKKCVCGVMRGRKGVFVCSCE